MIMYSFRLGRRVRRSAALLLFLLGIIAIGRLFIASDSVNTSAVMQKQAGKSEAQRQEFLRALGWQAGEEPVEVSDVVIPKEFDEVYKKYNEIQKEQGLDLSKYRGKRCKRYSYAIENFPGQVENVRLNILVCSGKIIGGDVYSLGMDGFMQGLVFPAEIAEKR